MNAVHTTLGSMLPPRAVAQALPARVSGPVGRLLEGLVGGDGGSVAVLYTSNNHDSQLALADVRPTRFVHLLPARIALGTTAGDPAWFSDAAMLQASINGCSATLSSLHLEGLSPASIEPIYSSSGRMLGVLCLLVARETSLSPRALDLVQALTPSLAVLLEHERIYETTRRDAQLADLLPLLADSTAREVDLQAILQEFANLGLRIAACDSCAVFIREQGYPRFRMQGLARLSDSQVDDIPEVLTFHELPAGAGARQILLDAASVCDKRSAARQRRSALVAPAFAENRNVGLIVAVDQEQRAYTPDDGARLEQLAQALATIMRNRELLERTAPRTNLIDLMWSLLAPGDTPTDIIVKRLAELGCDVTTPHVVLIGEAASSQAIGALRRRLLELDRSAPAAIDPVHHKLTAIVQSRVLSSLIVDEVTIGSSRPVREPSDYPTAYREADEALALGGKSLRMRGLIRFEDLGGYRFVPALVESGLTRDSLYQQVARLPSELLLTLEAYLGSGGNTVQAARQLIIHRNTMRQRMDKIRSLLDVDPTDPQQWLYLQLATMVTRSGNSELGQVGRAALSG